MRTGLMEKGDLAKTSKEVYINLELLKRYSQHSSLFLQKLNSILELHIYYFE